MKIYRLMIVLLLTLLHTTVIRAQTELHCLGFEFDPQPVATLPGRLVYMPGNVPERGFRVLDGTNFEWQAFDNQYLTISPNGRWLIRENAPVAVGSDRFEEFWMHDLEGVLPPRLLMTTAFHSIADAEWLNDQTLLIRWGGVEYRDALKRYVIIRPFEEPVQYFELATYINDWYIVSWSPNMRYWLLRKPGEYAIYDMENDQSELLSTLIEFPPVNLLPQWASDSRLAYIGRTRIDETARTFIAQNYEEIFVADIPTGIVTQLTDFEDAYGTVDITRQISWSPDGRYLAFKLSRFDGDEKLWDETQFPLGTTPPGAVLYALTVETKRSFPFVSPPLTATRSIFSGRRIVGISRSNMRVILLSSTLRPGLSALFRKILFRLWIGNKYLYRL